MRRVLTLALLTVASITFAQNPGPTGATFSNACLTTGDISWTDPATTNTILVFAKATSAITVGSPSSDISTYTANTAIGSGTAYQNDASAFCVYKGNGSSVSISGLTAGLTYNFIIFNATGTIYSTAATFSGATLSTPDDVSGLMATPASSQASVSWTNPTTCFDEIMIVAKQGSAVTGTPTGNGSSYSDNLTFGSGTAFGGGFVVFKGNSSPQNINTLTNGLSYYFKVFVRKGTTWSAGNEVNATVAVPPVTAGSFSSVCMDNGNISWTNPPAAYTIAVFAKASSAITVGTPTSNESVYNGNSTFGSGTAYQNDAAAFCVYKGNGTNTNITGLSAGMTYYFLIYNIDVTSYSPSLTFSGTSLSVPPNVTGIGSTPADSQIALNWTNPASCFDEILVVAKAGSAVTATPSGDGSTYSANNNFGTGTAIAASEFVVFKSSGNSVNVTGLTNGTTYHFKIFTRKGTVWSTGATFSDSPIDTTPPTAISLAPANGASNLSINLNNVVITFSEPVSNAGDNSNAANQIIIYNITDNIINETINPQAAGKVVLSSGNTVATIALSTALASGKNYGVRIGNKVIKDLASNFFGGTTDGTWNFTIATFTADAGSNGTICKGESVTLGGNPSANGGTGFYQYTWDTGPATTVFSTLANPVVSPTSTTIYRLTVTDSSPTQISSTTTITVKQPEDPNNLKIIVNPVAKFNKTYLQTDPKVQLSYLLSGAPGSYPGQTRFEGSGVNSSDFNKYFYPDAANIGENIVKLIYENPAGCLTQITDTLRVVTQNGLMAGLDPLYCNVNATDAITINEPSIIPDGVNYYFGYRYTYIGPVQLYNDDNVDPIPDTQITDPNAVTISGKNITINPGFMSTGYKYFSAHYKIEYLIYNGPADPQHIYYTYSDYVLNSSFFVADKPVLTLNIADKYCENDGLVQLTKSASPAGGTFNVNGSNTGLDFGGGVTSLNTGSSSLPDNITISYIYTNAQGCSNTASVNAIIYRLPKLDFNFNNGCAGDSIVFTPALTSTNNIDKYIWKFTPTAGTDTLAGASLGPVGNAYQVPGSYKVSIAYQTNTAKQCKEKIEHDLVIGEIPKIDFAWKNVCEGDDTQFFGIVNGLGTSSVLKYEWDFDGGGYVPNTKNTTHGFSQGIRTVKFKVTTNKNCYQQTQDTVYTVPTKSVLDIPYDERFDSSNGGWVSGVSNLTPTSWSWDIPTGFKLNADASGSGKAWFTNSSSVINLHYNLNEKSWVHSPCFDLSEIERPVLSLKIRSLTQASLDGVVIQIDSTNNGSSEASWKTLGVVNETPNWYNSRGIPGNPGLQTLNQIGWSDSEDSVSWRNALLSLDNHLPRQASNLKKIRFRIAFGSQGSNLAKDLDGFSFDNFKITERNRTVLLEYFTNEASLSTNSIVNNFTLKPTTFTPKSEIIELQYHLGMPNGDAIYNDNTVDPSARAAYYGITSTPSIRIDANYQSSPFANWAPIVFAQRTLKSSPIRIDTIYSVNDDPNTLHIHTEFTVLESLPANTIAQIVIIEKAITKNSIIYRYVVKKMLPSAAGTKFSQELLANPTPLQVDGYWKLGINNVYDPAQLAVIVFLQNEDTQEVYQSRLLENLNFTPTLVTGTEQNLTEQINVFPNPADQSVVIQFPQAFKEDTPIKIFDVNGRQLYQGIFGKGEHNKVIHTLDFESGLYLLQINAKSIVRRKIMVLHQ